MHLFAIFISLEICVIVFDSFFNHIFLLLWSFKDVFSIFLITASYVSFVNIFFPVCGLPSVYISRFTSATKPRSSLTWLFDTLHQIEIPD